MFLERREAQGRYRLPRLSFHLFPNAKEAVEAYASGEVNAVANLASRGEMLTLPNSRAYTQTDSSVTMILFNWKESIFAERRLRQALSLSLDLPALVRRKSGCRCRLPPTAPIRPGSSVYRPNPFWLAHDQEQALALLDAAQIAPGDPGESDPESDSSDAVNPGMQFSLLIEDSNPLRQLAGDIAAQWVRLGFQVEVESVSANELANRLSTGRFDSAIATLRIGGDFDLYRYWHPAQYDNGRNYGAVSNHEIAELIEQARREIYSSRRALLQQNFQEAFATDAIAIPLYYPLFTFIVDAEIEGNTAGLSDIAGRSLPRDWRLAHRRARQLSACPLLADLTQKVIGNNTETIQKCPAILALGNRLLPNPPSLAPLLKVSVYAGPSSLDAHQTWLCLRATRDGGRRAGGRGRKKRGNTTQFPTSL